MVIRGISDKLSGALAYGNSQSRECVKRTYFTLPSKAPPTLAYEPQGEGTVFGGCLMRWIALVGSIIMVVGPTVIAFNDLESGRK